MREDEAIAMRTLANVIADDYFIAFWSIVIGGEAGLPNSNDQIVRKSKLISAGQIDTLISNLVEHIRRYFQLGCIPHLNAGRVTLLEARPSHK